MMYCVVLFVVACVAVAAGLANMEECMKLSHPRTMHCCKTRPGPPPPKRDDLKECFEKGAKPPSCDEEICVGKKLGYTDADDGTFDKKLAEKHIDEKFASYPEMAEAIKKDCINGDISAYPPPDACDLVKLKHCIHAHALMACTEWKTDGECSGVKDLVDKCSKA